MTRTEIIASLKREYPAKCGKHIRNKINNYNAELDYWAHQFKFTQNLNATLDYLIEFSDHKPARIDHIAARDILEAFKKNESMID